MPAKLLTGCLAAAALCAGGLTAAALVRDMVKRQGQETLDATLTRILEHIDSKDMLAAATD